jgi:hypothetical protein
MIIMALRTDGHIKLDEEQAIAVRELGPTAHLALQDTAGASTRHSLLQVGSWT